MGSARHRRVLQGLRSAAVPEDGRRKAEALMANEIDRWSRRSSAHVVQLLMVHASGQRRRLVLPVQPVPQYAYAWPSGNRSMMTCGTDQGCIRPKRGTRERPGAGSRIVVFWRA
jgi:hypothetical protein